jgi:hypothetical protein
MENHSRRITAEELTDLLALPHSRDAELEGLRTSSIRDIYALDDGRIVVSRYAVPPLLFSDRSSALAILQKLWDENQEFLKVPEWEHQPLYGKSDENFPDRTGYFIDQLRQRLGVGSDYLDLSEESAARLDSLVEESYPQEIPDEIFPEILAYVGEILVTHYRCKWEMYLDKSFGKVWEPWLVSPSGKRFQIISRLLNSMLEDDTAGAEFVLRTVVMLDLKE